MGNVRKGMTLIELVVAIVLTGILAGLGAVIIRQVIDSWNIVSSRAEASSQMNIALSRMSRQIRSVRGRLSVLGARQILSGSSITTIPISRIMFPVGI